MTESTYFILGKGSDKHIPSSQLEQRFIDLVASNYTIIAAPELDVRVMSITAKSQLVGSVTYGILVSATISTRVPKQPTAVVMTFPNALRLRDLVGADSPSVAPSIGFDVIPSSGHWWTVAIVIVIVLGVIGIIVSGDAEAGCLLVVLVVAGVIALIVRLFYA